MHLAIDGYGGDYRKLADPQFVGSFLDSYPQAIGMTKIMAPHVMTYNAPNHEDWGVSGFVIIAESHISVHTFPERSYVNVDVFSCKEFDAKKAYDEIVNAFSLKAARSWVLERGLEHYTPEKAQWVITEERQQAVSRSRPGAGPREKQEGSQRL